MSKEARRRKILVVEPDPDLQVPLLDFLDAQRFDTSLAISGDEALIKAADFKPDLILLSRELPADDGAMGPDGLRVLKLLKENQVAGAAPCPIILAAENPTEKDFDRYRKLKFTADDYMRRPFEDTELLRRIENLIGFDISDDIDHLKDKIADVMEDDPFANMFTADPSETGVGLSEAARREVAQLLEQMGNEIEQPDGAMGGEEPVEQYPDESPQLGQPEEPEEEREEPQAVSLDEHRALNRECQTLRKQLGLAQKQLVSERKRSRESKKEWKQKLQKIAQRLSESNAREARIKDQFEQMRSKISDLELDHTMEMESVQNEKRRMEEEIIILKEREEALKRINPEHLAKDLKKIIKALEIVTAEIEGEKEK